MKKKSEWVVELVPVNQLYHCGSRGQMWEVYIGVDVAYFDGMAGDFNLWSMGDNVLGGSGPCWVVMDLNADFGTLVWLPSNVIASNAFDSNTWRYEKSIAPQGFIVGGEEIFINNQYAYWIRKRRRFDLE